MQLDAICGDKSALLSSCLDIAELERQGACGSRTKPAAGPELPRRRNGRAIDSLTPSIRSISFVCSGYQAAFASSKPFLLKLEFTS
jgi:hypothetical protein